jgi:hypothetical protein
MGNNQIDANFTLMGLRHYEELIPSIHPFTSGDVRLGENFKNTYIFDII